MDAKKFLELQGQIKQNNQEYLEFVSELDSWKADLDKKRQRTEQKKQISQDDKLEQKTENLPPVRNSLMKKKYKKKPKQTTEAQKQQQQTKKIAAYDYRAWDKFDVDKACEDLDKARPADKPEEDEFETDEEWEEERRAQLAEMKKTAGNEAFKAGRYDEAIELYTKATQLNPETAVYYCNRAMALLKLDRFAAAEADCCAALELDSKMVKAYYRRCQARQKLGKNPEALRDLEEAAALEPGNKALQTELKQLRITLQPEKYATGEVEPIFDKPIGQRSVKPLVRVSIQEVSETAIAAAAVAAAAAAASPSTTNGTSSKITVVGESKIESKPEPKLASSAQMSDAVDLNSVRAPSVAQSQPMQPPETAFQFKTAYRSLARRDPLAFCTTVLCAVPPERLPVLIGESLESDALLYMAAAFQSGLVADSSIASRVYQCLRLMADRVRRFSTCVAFLSANEKARLGDLMRQLSSSLTDETQLRDLKLLAAAYGVADAV